MYDGHREKRIDIGLRLGGAVLGGASSLAVSSLAALHLCRTASRPRHRRPLACRRRLPLRQPGTAL